MASRDGAGLRRAQFFHYETALVRSPSNRLKQTLQFEVIYDDTSILMSKGDRQEPARPLLDILQICIEPAVSFGVVNCPLPRSRFCYRFNRKINLLHFVHCWYSSMICNSHTSVGRAVVIYDE